MPTVQLLKIKYHCLSFNTIPGFEVIEKERKNKPPRTPENEMEIRSPESDGKL